MTSTSSQALAQQIAALEYTIETKKHELVLTQQIEDLDRQISELTRCRQSAALELQRYQAERSLAEVAAASAETPAETTDQTPAEIPADTPDHTPADIPADTITLVRNVFGRLCQLDPASDSFDSQANILIDRVKTEGTAAVRLLCSEFGQNYNNQYRRTIRSALRKIGDQR